MLVGALLRKIKSNRVVSGALSFSGSVTSLARNIVSKAGSISPSGAISYIRTKHASITKSGSLSFSGAYSYIVTTAQQAYTATGILSFAGAVVRKIKALRTNTGALSLSGAYSYMVTLSQRAYTATGDLTFSGVVSGIRSFVQRLYSPSGSLSFSGSVVGQTLEQYLYTASGAVGFSGTLSYVANPIISKYHFGVDNLDGSFIGDQSSNGSWRFIQSGNDLNAERRESGVWVKKGDFTP